jgi:hypothetical protein
VKNLISTLNPELSNDELRTNGFGFNVEGLPDGEDPWLAIFPDEFADAMTLTSESEDESNTGNRRNRRRHGALDPWETAVGILSQSVQDHWGLHAEITAESSEISGDERDNEEADGGSTSSDSTARMYNIAPLFSNSSEWQASPESSDAEGDGLFGEASHSEGEEEEDFEPMLVDSEGDAFQLRHPNQQYLMAAYKQLHRVPAPIRNCTWTTRSWEPPAFVSEENEITMTAQEKTLHQRGIPLDMQDKFQIAYTNRLGLSVQLGLGNVIFLGWNVNIFWSMGDRTGEVFMAYIRWEMRNHPERWNVHLHQDGSWDAHRLRCLNMDGDNAYASLGEDPIDGSDTE